MNESFGSPLVSVAVITYNQEKYIKKCIESILQQKTDFNFEIVIGDDCSTDRTREYCLSLQKAYPEKIKLLFQPENRGLMGNYISTLQLCRGKYIAQIAGDDYFTDPYKLQKQLTILENNPNYGLVFTDVDFLYEESNKTERSVFAAKTKKYSKNFEEHLLNKGFIAPMTWMYRSELSPLAFQYKKNYADESYPYILDMFKTSEIYFLNESTAVRRVQKQSASHHTNIETEFRYKNGVFEIQKEYIDKYNVEKKLKDLVLSSTYIELLPLAIQLKKNNLLQEAENFFETRNISFSALSGLAKKLLKQEKKGSNKINQLYLRIRKII